MSTALKKKSIIAYRRFLSLVVQGRYFEAHEVLEALWYPRRFEKGAEVLLLKGLINAAVALELLHRHRLEASRRVWQTFLKYRPLINRAEEGAVPLVHRIDRRLVCRYIQAHAVAQRNISR